jgi:GH24 family phage-related lysozyme (muramidase)
MVMTSAARSADGFGKVAKFCSRGALIAFLVIPLLAVANADEPSTITPVPNGGSIDVLLANTGDLILNQKGIDLIKQYEGFELKGYLLGDGMCTIGFGHAVPVAQRPDCTSWTITEAEALDFLTADSIKFSGPINEYFTREFNQNQFDALVSFSYNTGFAYQKYEWPKDAPDSYFPNVMIQYVNPPQFRAGLTRRRQAEIALFEDTNLPAPSAGAQSGSVPPAAIDPGSSTTSTQESPSGQTTQFPPIQPLFLGGLNG